MQKFGRNYILSVQGPAQASGLSETIVVQPPLTLEFDITRKILASSNTASLRIYNLGPKSREQMRFNISNIGEYRRVTLYVGYGSNLSLAFSGNMTEAWSAREGNTFVTTIECFDGGFALDQGKTSRSFPAGTPYTTIIRALMNDLPNVATGAIGKYPGTLPMGASYSGKTAEILSGNELTGGGFFIDNETANALGPQETLPVQSFTINAGSGLLETPLLQGSILTFPMLLEPRLSIGQSVTLDSSTADNYNGAYKVQGLKHRGMISGAVCGDATTSAEMLYLGVLAVAQ